MEMPWLFPHNRNVERKTKKINVVKFFVSGEWTSLKCRSGVCSRGWAVFQQGPSPRKVELLLLTLVKDPGVKTSSSTKKKQLLLSMALANRADVVMLLAGPLQGARKRNGSFLNIFYPAGMALSVWEEFLTSKEQLPDPAVSALQDSSVVTCEAEPALPERQQNNSLCLQLEPRTPVKCFTLPVLEPLTLPRMFWKWYRQNSPEQQITDPWEEGGDKAMCSLLEVPAVINILSLHMVFLRSLNANGAIWQVCSFS
ncbi:hypothetical protein EK904_010368 [Melospiza melodia maxima]|nr:hypothetical protein EK904_010368 [Melospiza melodia maxima]